MPDRKYEIKVALFGTPYVGKTAICKRLLNPQQEIKNIQPTIGVQFHKITLYPDPTTQVYIEISDSTGQQSHFSLTKQAVRNAAITLVVFDIGDRKSFEDVEKYVIRIQDMMHHQARIVLIGNKHDLINTEGAVQQNEARQLQARLGLHDYMEVSALTNHNINYAFLKPIEDLLHEVENNPQFKLDKTFLGIKNLKAKEHRIKLDASDLQNKKDQKKRSCGC